MSDTNGHIDAEGSTTDHLCIPCDVDTMARRLNLDKRRVQQIAKAVPAGKNGNGAYNCPRMVAAYSRLQQGSKRNKASNLTKKQEESLEIRNARDRAEVMKEWGLVVVQKAIVEELAPMFVTLKNGMRQIPATVAGEIMLFAKEYAQSVKDEVPVADYELIARAQKMLAASIDEKLNSCEKEIREWMNRKDQGDLPQKNAENAEEVL